MKKILVYSLAIISIILMSSMANPTSDMVIITKKKYTKTIDKSFPISKSGEVAISNKYGNIDMNTWDKNEVQIKVDIIVNATSESVAEDVFESISIHFEDTKNRVFAETEIETGEGYWWNWGKNLKSDYEINYTINMPITCSVNFSNKYGNVDIMDLENDAHMSIKYGNLTMGDLNGDLSLELGYGNAYVGMVKDVTAEIYYSKLRVESLKDMAAETKYSGLTVNNADKIACSSKYDNYTLGNIGEFVNQGKYDNILIDACGDIVIETKYSDLKVGALHRSLVAELNYGGIRIKELKKGFDHITIESDYAGVNLGLGEGTSFDLSLDSKYLEVHLPENSKLEDEQDGSQRTISGSYGKGKKGTLSLEMNYGHLKIN